MRILEEFWYGNTDCLIFQNGFKLGARIMLEVMEE